MTDAEYNGLRLQLATLRQLLGMTQAQISKAADISHVAVQALERGRYRTTRRVLGKYVAVLVNEAIAKGIDPNRLPPLPTALEIVAAKRTSLGRRGQSGRRSQKAIDQSLPPSPAIRPNKIDDRRESLYGHGSSRSTGDRLIASSPKRIGRRAPEKCPAAGKTSHHRCLPQVYHSLAAVNFLRFFWRTKANSERVQWPLTKAVIPPSDCPGSA